MSSKTTKQGVRNLNSNGPKKARIDHRKNPVLCEHDFPVHEREESRTRYNEDGSSYVDDFVIVEYCSNCGFEF